jgi:hypothetical protein
MSTIWRGRIASLSPVDVAPFGIAAMYIYGVASSVFFPLNGMVDWIAILAGWVGLITGAYRNRGGLPDWRLTASVAAVIVLLAFGAAVTPINFDSGLYQLQVMKYVETEPVPLGIANIQDRLGFNSATIVLGSLLDGALFGRDGSFLITAAIFLLFAVSCLVRCRMAWSGAAGPFTGLFAGILLCLWFGNLNGLLFEWFSHGPNGDIPGAIFCSWAFVTFFSLVERTAETDSAAPEFLLLTCCCVLAAAIKLSQAPVLALLPIVWRICLSSSTRSSMKSPHGPLMPIALVGIAWFGFGIMTSGCLAFPLPGSCLTFLPWAADPAEAKAQHDAIRAWARTPGVPPAQVLSGWNWISGWTEKMLPYRPIFYSVLSSSLLALLLGGGLRLLRKTSVIGDDSPAAPAVAGTLVRPWLAALAVSAFGVAFWFVQAPDPRFGVGFMLCLASVLAAGIVLVGAGSVWPAAFRDRAGSILAGILLLASVSEALALSSERESSPVLAWRNPPAPKMRDLRTQSGLAIRTPINGTQCWAESEICVAYDRSRLSTRRIFGRTAFTVEGSGGASQSFAAAPAGPFNSAVFDSSVWGEEAASFANRAYTVRWLRKSTPFTIESETARAASVRISLGSHDGPREVELIVNGQSTSPPQPVEKNFFASGPQELSFPVQLTAGRNTFELRSLKDCTEISPGRPACLLLVGDIEVGGAK